MHALRAKVTAANDGMWDRVFGIETSGEDCRPTSYRVLFKVFAAIALTGNDDFVDFGCGRGRVLCVAARYPLQRVRGVELNPVTAQGARSNLTNLRGRKTVSFSIQTGSAADFDCGGGSVFYFYNPFGGALFTEVIENVRRAAARAPQPIRVVYINPVCREVLDGADWLQPAEVVHQDAHGKAAAIVYRGR